MDILETHAFDRRQQRKTVLFCLPLRFITRMVKTSSFLMMCLFFCLFFLLLFPPPQSYALFLSLLPFFLAAALFFYLRTPESPSSITSAGVKAAPVLLLAVMVLSWSGGQSVLGVVGGLVFSAVGDCCLVWPEYFLHGMCLFCVRIED